MLDAKLDVTALQAADLQGLSQGVIAELATQMLARITLMGAQLEARDEHIARVTVRSSSRTPRSSASRSSWRA